MQAEIITIGDEILIGQIVDSNATYIAKALNDIGVTVYEITSVQDDEAHILQSLQMASTRSQLVVVTGGLGPTKDDITKHTFCKFFADELVEDPAVLAHVEALFKKYISTPISDLNRKQALVPAKATVLHNALGTAPGMWMEKDGVVFVSLPGVPFEMKGLMQNEVIPKVMARFNRPHIIHKTIITYGLGESAIAEKIADWEDALPQEIKLAYLPSLGMVRLRLSAKSNDRQYIEKLIATQLSQLYPLIGDIIYGEEEGDAIEVSVGKLLTQKEMTLATAESFTGGKIAQQLTAIPGASKYFKGTVVSYATETKIDVLGVDAALVATHSVVSAPVAKAMAQNVRRMMQTDFAIATTGNAGPTKGDSNAAVGTVFIAISTPKNTLVKEFNLGKHRERIVQKGVNKAFELLQKEILNF